MFFLIFSILAINFISLSAMESNVLASSNALTQWDAESCGICKKSGTSNSPLIMVWPTKFTKGAHFICFEKIVICQKDIENSVLKLVPLFTPASLHHKQMKHLLHIELIAAIEGFAQSSIGDYYEKFGPEATRRLFNTIGNMRLQGLIGTIKSIVKIESRLKSEHCDDMQKILEYIYEQNAPFRVKNKNNQ